MSGAEIRVSASPGERRAALIEDGVLTEAWCERPARPDGVGDVHLGRVRAVVPALSGAFVELADGVQGFLPEAEAARPVVPIGRAVSEGQALPVRVARAAQGGKGPRLTALLDPPEPATGDAPRLLRRGPDAAERLAAAYPAAPILADDPALAARLRARLGAQRVAFARDAFDAALEAEFAALHEPEVPLPGGGRLSIHPTPALTAIDVDGGPRDPAEANRDAIAEAARQIRLRNLSGAILLDPAGLSVKRRAALLPAVRAAIGRDPLLRLHGLTPGGLIEFTRARIHPPLHEVLAGPLAPGLAALRRVVREAAASPAARLVLVAHPAVIAALEALPGALAEANAALAYPLLLRPDAARAPGREEVLHG
ncbi:MAG: ribonuclease E/G [Acetobacteraceae bacterium]